MIHNTRQVLGLDGEWEMIVPRELGTGAKPAPLPRDLGTPARYEVRSVTVPTTWEREGVPKPYTGPVWFRRTFPGAPFEPGETLYLRFGAVSAVATVWLNGKLLGSHRGIWDCFEMEIPRGLAGGGENTLVVVIHKPGGRYPVRSSLAGFIPYVTTTFGGIWQSVDLVAAPDLRIEDLCVRSRPSRGVIEVTAGLRRAHASRPTRKATRIELSNGVDGLTVSLERGETELHARLRTQGQKSWSPEEPALHTLRVSSPPGGAACLGYGIRDVRPDGARVLLNGAPRYLRGALHWCAYTDLYSPTPDRPRIEHEMRALRELGYNMVKLCLVVPHDLYFDVADELGMLLWVELPLWMPVMDAGFARRAAAEYTAIVRRIRSHPSVVVWTLGCELDRAVDARTLKSLYDLVRAESGSTMVRDNSGSPECYGGVAEEYADFHDYHFYAEANQFGGLMDHFSPHWKERKPLLFGEYCDCDTFRSVAQLYGDTAPWWARADPVDNPQGVRWDYSITANRERIAAGTPVPVEQLKRLSYLRALEYRMDILSQTRRRMDTAGYVVTNLQDTPLSTSGMLDDLGEHKFDPAAFRAFNADTVLSVEVERRRVWRAGGDRPQCLDEWCLSTPGRFRRRMIVSHFGDYRGAARLDWELRQGRRLLGRGAFRDLDLEPGRVFLAGTADAAVGGGRRPGEVVLSARLSGETGHIALAQWRYWLIPDAQALEGELALWDPGDRMADLGRVARGVRRIGDPAEAAGARLLVATAYHTALREPRGAGTALLLLLDGAQADFLEPCPFFREGIGVVHAHPLVDDLPHHGYGGIHWKGVAPDRALKPAALAQALGVQMEQVIARFDARTFLTTSYLLATKGGKPGVIATTLRLAGGLGRQPGGLEHNLLGRHLLWAMIDRLARGA